MLIDLSLPLENGPSEREAVVVTYYDHAFGAAHMEQIFGVRRDQLPDRIGWAGEEVRAITHAGTHMDAPYHYGPRSDTGPAWTIDQVPLDWCTGPAAVLDMTGKEDRELISVPDVCGAIDRLANGVPAIVLIRTGADRHWGHSDYPERGPGLSGEATRHLVEQGVRVIGIDAWGLDRPFSAMRADYERTGDPGWIWPAHFYGRERPYLQLEKLTNLDRLPDEGFEIFAFPVKVARASAGWTRVVAKV